jgi:hypothetical protein
MYVHIQDYMHYDSKLCAIQRMDSAVRVKRIR